MGATGAEITWTGGVDYSLTGAGVEASGKLTDTVSPASGETLVILRQPPETQRTDLPLGGSLHRLLPVVASMALKF